MWTVRKKAEPMAGQLIFWKKLTTWLPKMKNPQTWNNFTAHVSDIKHFIPNGFHPGTMKGETYLKHLTDQSVCF